MRVIVDTEVFPPTHMDRTQPITVPPRPCTRQIRAKALCGACSFSCFSSSMKHLRRLLQTGVLVGSFALLAPVFAAFDDVATDDQYGPSILHLQQQGIVQGFPDNTYRPQDPITRAEYTKILLLAKYEEDLVMQCDQGSFPDVEDYAWYAPFVCFARQEAIVSGYGDGTFRPNADISYAEAAKIMVNVMIAPTEDATGDMWWTNYTTRLEEHGAKPPTVDTAAATEPLTRGEMAFMASTIMRDTTADFIEAEFDGKFVYVQNPGTEVSELQAHCAVEGGQFDECGSPCAPDAEMCAEVCAYTCNEVDSETDFIQDDFGSKIVYEMSSDISQDDLRRHCALEGGEFNTCGSVCAPDAEVCVKMCGLTCEGLQAGMDPDEPAEGDPDEDETQESDIIRASYDDKLVYRLPDDYTEDDLRMHCEETVGGEFDTCGDECEPGAEICNQVCAYTCTGFDDGIADDAWLEYENPIVGFRVEYPAAMSVEENVLEIPGHIVQFMVTGDEQAPNTELTDGASVTFDRINLQDGSLSAYVDADIAETEQVGEITVAKEEYQLDEYAGYRYVAETLGEVTHIFLQVDPEAALGISYTVVDPNDEGYELLIEQMLQSVELLRWNSTQLGDGLGIYVEYPDTVFEISTEAQALTLVHEVSYIHPDPCDLSGDPAQKAGVRELDLAFRAHEQTLATTVGEMEPDGFVEDHLTEQGDALVEQEGFIDAAAYGELEGWRVTSGAGGCGEYRYYFPVDEQLTLTVTRAFVPEFAETYAERDTVLELDGIIPPEEADILFEAIMQHLDAPQTMP